jgi:hypothetical protein
LRWRSSFQSQPLSACLPPTRQRRGWRDGPDGGVAAMAAKFSGSVNKPDIEPGVAMTRTLAVLQKSPLTVEAGRDDGSQILHPTRFLGGDFASIGLGGCVTMRGFKKMHNPPARYTTPSSCTPPQIRGALAVPQGD